MAEYKSKQLIDGLFFPEGARWFRNKLWFGDIHAGRVMSVDESGQIRTVAQFDTPCSGVGFLPDGTVLASLMKDRVLAWVDAAGKRSTQADLAAFNPDHINDVVTDIRGRTYVDCLAYHMHWFDPELHPSGTTIHRFQNKAADTPLTVTDQIVLVNADGSARVVAADLLGPNGLAITGDGKYLVVAEWRVNRLTRFRIEPDGSLVERELFAETAGLPDGICVDAEDAVWVASPTTGDCVRVLKGGQVTDRVRPVGKRVTACVLGGADRRTLYLTTDEMPALGTGRIEMVDVKVPGAGFP